MNYLAIAGIQARMGSTRFPGKVMEDICGKPMIHRVVDRVRQCNMIDDVIVLVPEQEGKTKLTTYCRHHKIPITTGDQDDVFSRYWDTFYNRQISADYVVRITSDCPLIEPKLIDYQIRKMNEECADLVLMEDEEHVRGTLGGATIMSHYALRTASELIQGDKRDREHVASFFFKRDAWRFRHIKIKPNPIYSKIPRLRLCVDEPPDLELVRRVYEHFGDTPFMTTQVIDYLDKHPEVRRLNMEVQDSEDNKALRRMERG